MLAVTLNDQVEAFNFRRVAYEGNYLDGGDGQCGQVCVVQIVDQIMLLWDWSMMGRGTY